MKLYRVTFTTELLVECNDEREAERIGYRNLREEAFNSQFHKVETIETVEQLRRGERNSLPWRDAHRFNEPEARVEEILLRTGK